MNKRSYPTLILLVCLVTRSLADDLTPLSDEFGDSSSLSNWSRVFEVEGWGADQMESIDIDASRSGYLTMVPKTSSWYRDWRGILLFKRVTGDFVATMEVEPRNRAKTGAPGSSYSLAGIMARAPRDNVMAPENWTAGGENYLFLSMGTANDPGNYQFEVKSTVSSNSSLGIDEGAPRAVIQIVRLGGFFLVLRKLEGSEWEVHRRYQRSDLPDTLQVGITVYTDWEPVSLMEPFAHNQASIDGNNPDLDAAVDYFRYSRPRVPSWLNNEDFLDPTIVTDEQVIQLFADRANRDPSTPPVVDLDIIGKTYVPGLGMQVEIESVRGYSYRVERSLDLQSWSIVDSAEATSDRLKLTVPEVDGSQHLFVRVAEE